MLRQGQFDIKMSRTIAVCLQRVVIQISGQCKIIERSTLREAYELLVITMYNIPHHHNE